MPSMKLFGRRWAVSSDDFVYPAATEGMARFVWFIVTLCVYVLHPHDHCAGAYHLQVYILAALVHNAVIISTAFATAYVSSRGSVRNPVPRRRLPVLLYVRCVSIVFELIWNVIGIVWFVRVVDFNDCDATLVAAGRLTLVGSWLLFGGFMVGFWFMFDPLGNLHNDDVKMTDQARRLWHFRLQLLCFCASGSDNAKAAFEDVAELLTDFFIDTDLVISDLWAAILLLANRDLAVMNERGVRPGSLAGKTNPVVTTKKKKNDEDEEDDSSADQEQLPEWMNLPLASRMMEFALGVYGWPYYICAHGCAVQPVCDLLHKIRCCSRCRCDNVIVIKDNCCGCNTAAMLLHTGIAETDLFHVNLHNEVWESPFVACLDHQSRSIVVAIRGSLSLRDAVTDMCMREDAFDLENQMDLQRAEQEVLRGVSVHKGMLWSARYVYSKLENEKILDDLFVLQPEYELMITGHSLGAGVAALLAMLLKPKYAGVRCFAFSPPGCVISENAIPFTERFVCSVIVGDDLVPRLSMQSMQRFKSNILDVLEHCDQPKWEILLKGCFRLLCAKRPRSASRSNSSEEVRDYAVIGGVGGSSNGVDVERGRRSFPNARLGGGNGDLNVSRSESIEDESQDAPLILPRNRSFQSYTEERTMSTNNGDDDIVATSTVNNGGVGESEVGRVIRKLRCPGRILHITHSNRFGVEATVSRLESDVAWRQCDYFAEVWLSSSMINDHMPYVVAAVLKEAANAAISPLVSST